MTEVVSELSALDRSLYAAVAQADTPTLDSTLRTLSGWADKSKLWAGTAVALGVLGGPRGRRAAVSGMAAVAVASASTNLVFKQLHRRARPDRAGAAVPQLRHVPMPASTSFPSGHSASAFAFAEGVSAVVPWLGIPLRLAATSVAYSRVHTGVHYPGDVVAGTLIGMTSAGLTGRALTRWWPRPDAGGTGRPAVPSPQA